MNYRIIGVISVMALAVATWFFYQEDVEIKPALPAKPTASYEVSEIKATQTNEKTGKTEYTLTAKSLVQNTQGQDELQQVVMQWQPTDQQSIILQADKATLNQDSGDLYLANGFRLEREATSDQPAMIIEGVDLKANTKTGLIGSQKALTITQGQDTFKAASFDANLKTKEYQFHRIEILYKAPKRIDKPVF